MYIHQEGIMHLRHSYALRLPIKMPHQPFPSYLSSAALILYCTPHWSFLSFCWEVIIHWGHFYSLQLPIEIPHQPFPSYSSSATLIPCCPPHWTFTHLFSVSISVFSCSSHHDTIMFSIISTAYRTAQQVKQRPMDSQSQCSGLWADSGDFLLSFVHFMCYSSQITQLCSSSLNNHLWCISM